AELFGCRLALLGVDVEQRGPAAGFEDALGGGEPQARGAAGNDGVDLGKLHGCLPFEWRGRVFCLQLCRNYNGGNLWERASSLPPGSESCYWTSSTPCVGCEKL